MANMKEANDELMDVIKQMSEEYKDEMGSFMHFLKVVEQDGALKVKQKELIALAVGLAKQCKWCIAFHTKGALDAGATRQEILETAWVTVLMGGGPTLAHMKYVLDALKDFNQQ
ncbi:MAG: carboxymuconolactone decarboxylase family protein [Nitrospiraceae bacterium]|nr:carboxymuconolactone decarboxylase family protein [Nitrospiraceae bacterium]